MKIKLKKGEQLSSGNNHCGLQYDNWIALNQGQAVEMDKVPAEMHGKYEEVKSTSKKGDE